MTQGQRWPARDFLQAERELASNDYVSLPGTWLGSLFGARLADSFGSRNVLIFFVAFLCLEVVYNVCVLTELPIFDSISSLNR